MMIYNVGDLVLIKKPPIGSESTSLVGKLCTVDGVAKYGGLIAYTLKEDTLKYDWTGDSFEPVEDSSFYKRGVKIRNVIFNDPATIVFWSDGSKTVVKACEKDSFDQEKGLAMAICKKVLRDRFKSTFNKYVTEHSDDNKKSCETSTVSLAEWYDKGYDIGYRLGKGYNLSAEGLYKTTDSES